MNKVLALCFGWLLCNDALGQAPEILWQKTYDTAYALPAYGNVARCSDGGYIMTGAKLNGANSSDVYVAKTDSAGNLEWQHLYGGSGMDEGADITPTSDGGFAFIATTTSDDGDVSGFYGYFDMWVVKLNNLGVIQWQKCLGGDHSERGVSIREEPSGNYVVGGTTHSTDGMVIGNHDDSHDYWMVRLSATGALLNQRCLGGDGGEGLYVVTPTSDNGFLLGGTTHQVGGDISGTYHGGMDLWLVKVDSLFDIQWQRLMGGSLEEKPFSIVVADTGYAVLASTNSTNGDVSGHHGNLDYWVLRLDEDGIAVWKKCFGGSAVDSPSDLVRVDNNLLVAGHTNSTDGDIDVPPSDLWLMSINMQGDLVGSTFYGDAMPPYADTARYYCKKMMADANGIALFGDSSSITSNGRYFWLAGLSDFGPQWLDLIFTVSDTITCADYPCSVDIEMQVAGNNLPHQFIWNTGDTLENLANVCPGTYTISVWDSTGFSMVESVTVSTVHNEVTVAATSTGATCELANGTIALAISGGIPPYTNYWTPWLLSQGTNITNIAAGTYLLHVEGENGCGDTLTITVLGTPALALDISFDAATCELANGDIDLTILTGTPPFQYVWSNGAITQDLVGVPTGLYNVDVTDSAGCTKSGFKFVPGSPAIQAIITPHAYCDSATGRITTQVYTGTLPYAFAWSNGSSQQHPHGLSLGVDYTVTITDAVGCTNVQTTPLHAAVAPATPVLQPDVNDNYLYAPPHPNYVYYWFVDGTLDLSANAYVHEMDTIFGGVYSVIVVDTSTHCSSDTSAGYAVIVDTYANVAYPTLYLTVFPNPAINEINFVVNCGGSLSLSDMFGRRIESRMFEGEAIHKIGNLDCGLYNYRFVSRSGETLSGKCLVVKD